jgi:hypothetical protein
MSTPSLPPGYQLDQNPTLPQGYTLDSNPSQSSSQNSSPSLLKEGISNLPESAIRLILSLPQRSGIGQTQTLPPIDPSKGPQDQSPEFKSAATLHPGQEIQSLIDSIGKFFNNPEEAFVKDPLGTLANLAQTGKGVKDVVTGPVGAVAKGAVKGAYQELAAPSPTGFGYIAKALSNVPGGATLLKAIVGKYAGQAIGGIVGDSELGGHIGAAAGITVPAIRGVIRGGKAGLAEYNATPASIDPRIQTIIDRLNY